jgi:hypothetical protein
MPSRVWKALSVSAFAVNLLYSISSPMGFSFFLYPRPWQ